MTEVLVTPDALVAATSYLREGLGELAGRVGTEVPATMPRGMVKVSLTGGSRSGIVSDTAQLTVECWDENAPATSLLARTSHAYMLAAAGVTAGGLFVRKAETVGGVQSFPDPDTNRPRWIFTVRWSFRPDVI